MRFLCFFQSENQKIDRLLRWVLHLKQKQDPTANNSLKSLLFNADFLSFRGLLTRVGSTLYQPSESWVVCVSRFQGVYFLCEFYSPKKEAEVASE